MSAFVRPSPSSEPSTSFKHIRHMSSGRDQTFDMRPGPTAGASTQSDASSTGDVAPLVANASGSSLPRPASVPKAGTPSAVDAPLDFRPTVLAALKRAEDAVSRDNAFQYEEALAAYLEVVQVLDGVLECEGDASNRGSMVEDAGPTDRRDTEEMGKLTAEAARKLSDVKDMYSVRVDTLLAYLPPERRANLLSILSRSKTTQWLAATLSGPLLLSSTHSNDPTLEMTIEAIFHDDPSISTQPPEPVPNNADRRPFYTMRALSRTIMSGGFLTPRLYVPRYVWHQTGVKLTALEAKISALESVWVLIVRARGVDPTDQVGVLRELDEFDTVTDVVRTNLARKLKLTDDSRPGGGAGGAAGGGAGLLTVPGLGGGGLSGSMNALDGRETATMIHSPSSVSIASTTSVSTAFSTAGSAAGLGGGGGGAGGGGGSKLSSWGKKISNSMEKLSKKGGGGEDFSGYVDLLSRVLGGAQVYETWMDVFEDKSAAGGGEDLAGGGTATGAEGGAGASAILGRLKRVSAFWAGMVCPFVVMDLEVLLEKFLKKARQGVAQ